MSLHYVLATDWTDNYLNKKFNLKLQKPRPSVKWCSQETKVECRGRKNFKNQPKWADEKKNSVGRVISDSSM